MPEMRKQDESDLSKIPQLDEREVQLISSFGWWDGPESGLAKYQDSICWFDFHHMDDEGKHYFYVLYSLTREQILEATHRSQARRENAKTIPQVDWHWLDLQDSTRLGWFMDGLNQSFYGVEVVY